MRSDSDKRLDRTAVFYERMAPQAHPAETAWRHHAWAGKRALVLASLARCGTHVTTRWNITQCGSQAVSQWSESLGRRRISAYYCKSRHCEPCARSKANKIAANLTARLEQTRSNQFRFVTLTLKHSTAPLKEQIDRLYKCFKKLRMTPLWKKSTTGGCAILEVKHNGKTWHPHLHACTEGTYLDQRALSAAWLKATGDSYIVDIKRITRGRDAAAYVSKYITKSTTASVWSHPARADEWVLASKGVRTANTFGSWRKWPLLAVTSPATDWVAEDRLIGLLTRANAGELHAQTVLFNLRPPGGTEEVHHCFPYLAPLIEEVHHLNVEDIL